MFTKTGEFYEVGYCPQCGLQEDRNGDCPNPLCPSLDPEIAALGDGLSLLDDLDDLDEPTKTMKAK